MTTYYVDSSSSLASDRNTGLSAGLPLASLDAVNRLKLQPGDVVAFRAGTTYAATATGAGALVVTASGTGDKPITFTSYGEGAPPIIKNLASGYSDGIQIVGAKNVTIDGLNITGGAQAGINIDKNSSYIRVQNVEASGVGEGVLLAGTNSLITHSYFHDLKMVRNTANGGDDDYGAVGIMIFGSNNEVSFTKIVNAAAQSHDYGRDGGGIDLYGTVSNISIHDNWVENSVGFLEAGGPKATISNVMITNNVSLNNGNFIVLHNGGGLFASTLSSIDASHNTIVNETNGAREMGTVFLDAAYQAGQLNFHDNAVYLNNGDSVFNQVGAYHSDNTFYLASSATHLYNNWSMALGSGESLAKLGGTATGAALVTAVQSQSGRGATPAAAAQVGVVPRAAIATSAVVTQDTLVTDTFGITGQSYVSEHKVVSANGTVVLLERYHADGSRDSSRSVGPDGSVTSQTYDAKGGLLRQTIARTDGSGIVDTYQIAGQSYASQHLVTDAAGKVTSLAQYHGDGTRAYANVVDADGSVTTSKYDDKGVPTLTSVVAANGSSLTTWYDAKGGLNHTIRKDAAGVETSLATFHADGTREFSRVLNGDGSTTESKYDAKGILTLTSVFDTHGGTLATAYNAKGGVTSTSQKDAAGVQTSLATFHADGTREFSRVLNGDGSTTESKYDATGHLTITTVKDSHGGTSTTWYDVKGGITQASLKDAVGVETSLVTYHADGTRDFARLKGGDGSTTELKYDAAGKLKADTILQKDGSSVAHTYGASGAVTQSTETHTDGSVDIYQSSILGKTYNAFHAAYDPSNHLQFNETFNNDGTHSVNLSAAHVTVAATSAKDIFYAYGGDTFVFGTGSGKDVVYGFHAGAGASHDTISLSTSVAADFAHLHLRQAGADVVVDLGAQDTITLKGVTLASLTHHDFLFI